MAGEACLANRISRNVLSCWYVSFGDERLHQCTWCFQQCHTSWQKTRWGIKILQLINLLFFNFIKGCFVNLIPTLTNWNITVNLYCFSVWQAEQDVVPYCCILEQPIETLLYVFCFVIILFYLCCFQAYYWRGMTRIKLKQSKGIQDFNRALALDPDLFQVWDCSCWIFQLMFTSVYECLWTYTHNHSHTYTHPYT